MRSTTSWMRGTALGFLLVFPLGLCAAENLTPEPVSQGRPLSDEINECELEDGGIGEYVQLKDCSKKLLLPTGASSEQYIGDSEEESKEEVVCCEKKVTARNEADQVRPAVAACNMYIDWFLSQFKGWRLPGRRNGPGAFPQVVAIGYPARPGDELVINGMRYDCAGTVISEQWVLTAAHCVDNVQGFVPVEVAILGEEKDLVTIKKVYVKSVPISKIVVHPEYQKSLHYRDIALIELKEPLTFRHDLRAACLMTEPLRIPTVGPHISLTVPGWGAKYLNGTKSTELFQAEGLKSVEKNECEASYRDIGAQIPNGLDEGMICIADPDGERESENFSGSNGEPLFLYWEIFPRIVGVASFGRDCCSGAPRIYTSVYENLDWIEAQVWRTGVPKTIGCWVLEKRSGLIDYMKDSCIAYPCYNAACLCRCDSVNLE